MSVNVAPEATEVRKGSRTKCYSKEWSRGQGLAMGGKEISWLRSKGVTGQKNVTSCRIEMGGTEIYLDKENGSKRWYEVREKWRYRVGREQGQAE